VPKRFAEEKKVANKGRGAVLSRIKKEREERGKKKGRRDAVGRRCLWRGFPENEGKGRKKGLRSVRSAMDGVVEKGILTTESPNPNAPKRAFLHQSHVGKAGLPADML